MDKKNSLKIKILSLKKMYKTHNLVLGHAIKIKSFI